MPLANNFDTQALVQIMINLKRLAATSTGRICQEGNSLL